MIEAKMTSKGQITIPKKVRDLLNLHTGDRVTFIISRDGKVILTTQTVGLDEIFGMFHHKSRGKTTVEDMDKAIAKRMRRKFK
jgi:antitoxin PrlF